MTSVTDNVFHVVRYICVTGGRFVLQLLAVSWLWLPTAFDVHAVNSLKKLVPRMFCDLAVNLRYCYICSLIGEVKRGYILSLMFV